MNDKELKTFPSTTSEAISIAWLQQQNLSNKTPEETTEIYEDAYVRIRERLKEIKASRR